MNKEAVRQGTHSYVLFRTAFLINIVHQIRLSSIHIQRYVDDILFGLQ